MRVKKLSLKNGYKRFFDLTIDLGEDPRRIVALIGPNGCGKSSVFDGLLFHNSAYQGVGNKGGKGYEYHSMNNAPDYNYHNIEIQFVEGQYQEIRGNLQSYGRENTIFSFRSPYRYNSSLNVKETRAVPEIRFNDYGASHTIDIDDKMEANYRRLYVKYNRYLNDEDCKPSLAKAKIIGDLNEALRNCLDLEIVSIGSIDADQGTLFFKKPDHPVAFQFNVLSSGEKEVVDIILDLYLRQDEYNDSVFLIDEPELHINTSIQKKLLIEINKLIGRNCQLWVATHSIGFLRALQDELRDECQIIEFKSGHKWASQAYTLVPMKKSRSNWREIFRTALDDLTELVSPKRIVYCEGRDKPGSQGEEKGFDAKVFNNIFSELYLDTVFVSSGGNTELDQRSAIALLILTKVFAGVEILVLKDRDISSGKPTSENDRQIYLQTNPSNHRVLKRWEIENYLFDKETLKKYCEANVLNFDEAEYDRFVTNVVNQNLKDATGRIKSICGITTSVNAEQFKLTLATHITPDMSVFKDLEECIFRRE